MTDSRWIKVEGRLPEEYGYNLCSIRGSLSMQVLWFDVKKKGFFHEYDYRMYELPVTHWMPLPEPPEENKEP